MGVWKKNSVIILCLIIGVPSLHAQQRKGNFYFNWGYNRAFYTKSDIHFRGENYNFILENVVAKDRPTPLDSRYYRPVTFTIPQYNFNIGYFFTDNLSIQINDDHMKYVMQNNVYSTITGRINNDASDVYKGQYRDTPIYLDEDFLMFEHTDGLNYINIDLNYSKRVFTKSKLFVDAVLGTGIGVLYPKTNTTLLKNERYDEFHLAGFGTHVIPSLRLTGFRYITLTVSNKIGYINMPDIRTTKFKKDKASQQFCFSEFYITIGGIIPVFKNQSN